VAVESTYRYGSMYVLSGSLNVNDLCKNNGLSQKDVMEVLQKFNRGCQDVSTKW
jgi:hypothetical protein